MTCVVRRSRRSRRSGPRTRRGRRFDIRRLVVEGANDRVWTLGCDLRSSSIVSSVDRWTDGPRSANLECRRSLPCPGASSSPLAPFAYVHELAVFRKLIPLVTIERGFRACVQRPSAILGHRTGTGTGTVAASCDAIDPEPTEVPAGSTCHRIGTHVGDGEFPLSIIEVRRAIRVAWPGRRAREPARRPVHDPRWAARSRSWPSHVEGARWSRFLSIVPPSSSVGREFVVRRTFRRGPPWAGRGRPSSGSRPAPGPSRPPSARSLSAGPLRPCSPSRSC